MRVVVFAYHDVGCAGLVALLEAGHDVAAVFTHRDDPEEDIWFGSVADLAAAHGLPVHAPERVNEPRWFELVRGLRPDAIFSFYYRRILAPEITQAAARGAINLHGSLLPRWRGRSPVNWVLIHGERETGVTLHHMIESPDAGDVIAQRSIPIAPEDTALTLHRKLVAAAGELVRDTLPSIERGTAGRTPQDPALATWGRRRRPADGRVDWARPAEEIHNLVRALTRPWPGAFTFAAGRRLFIWESAPGPAAVDARPGSVIGRRGLEVGTGAGALHVLRAQLADEEARGVVHLLRVGAEDLDAAHVLVRAEAREAQRLGIALGEAAHVQHLGHVEPGALPAAQRAEGRVGDAGHRREHHRRPDRQRGGSGAGRAGRAGRGGRAEA